LRQKLPVASTFIPRGEQQIGPKSVYSPQRFVLYFCWYLANKRLRRISLFPTEGIERMARKNDGAGANPNTSTAARSDRIRQGRVERCT
jgi:hypothetical protein